VRQTMRFMFGSLPDRHSSLRSNTTSLPACQRTTLYAPPPVIVPAVYHSELVKKNAKDPWGLEYTKTNIAEPLCVLVQESLAQVGIKTTINKIPGANWRNGLCR